MVWAKYIFFLAVLMVVTGSINTITAKWANISEANSRDGEKRPFQHPYMQALGMFIGEASCLLVFKILFKVYSRKGEGIEDVKELTKGNREFNPFIFVIPSMCDMLATSTMYVGLNLTYASSFQMLRGAVIIFVGILTVIFLHRKLKILEWAGICVIIGGLVIVGAADMLSGTTGSTHSTTNMLIGDGLIVIAQILTASQMVIEEKFVAGQDIPPLQAVGWEGIFGIFAQGLLLIPFYWFYIPPPFSNNPRGVLEDAIDAFVQMGNNPIIICAVLINIMSIGFFNFAGISITKKINAVTRKVLDTIRTIVVWVVSLAWFGQKFHYLQLLGFLAIIGGMCIYYGLTPKVCYNACRKRKPEEEENAAADASANPNQSKK